MSTVVEVPPAARALTLEVQDDGIAVITYDVPGAAVNTLRASFVDDFDAVYDALATDPRIRGAVLVSGKKDTWVAGADIEMLEACTSAEQAAELSRVGKAAMKRFEALRVPVVAALHGAALGGGFELALVCAARVASDDPKTLLGLPEVQLGLLPGASGLQRVARLAGLQVALDLGLTGKNLKAARAKKLGLVDEVVAAPALREAAVAWAKRLAAEGRPKVPSPLARLGAGFARPKDLPAAVLEATPLGRAMIFKKARETVFAKTQGHYPAPARIIDVLESYYRHGMEASEEVESRAFGELVTSDVARRLIEVFFATQALKKDNGTEDPAVEARPVRKIAMLGAGLMGAGIAYVSAQGGYTVRLKDKDDPALGRGLALAREYIDARVERRSITPVERDRVLARIVPTTDYSGFGAVDLTIEAVFEDVEVKHGVLRDTEARTRPDAIFASNTSTIRIAKIAEASARPETVVGMHYFSPVHKMPLLEVIATEKTAPWVVATAVAVGKKQGKTVIVVRDGYGFYTSRVLGPFMGEAGQLLAEGVPVDEVDRALVRWGFPVGPITLLDEVGIDVAAKAGKIMHAAFPDRFESPALFEKLLADGRAGRKGRKGFYRYDAHGKKLKGRDAVDTSVYALFGITPGTRLPGDEIAERCALQLVGEAIRCLEEGVLRSARDGDVGAIFGLGFPPFRGGPFRYADAVGARALVERFRGYEARFGRRWAPPALLVEKAATEGRFHSAR